jgi:acetyltransferase-like isoleucine patch superfamily enzyme
MNEPDKPFNTPWKIRIEILRWLSFPWTRWIFALNRIEWGRGWRLYGIPILQKHRQSDIQIGNGLQLRSTTRSNPLSPNHPVILCTWQAGAVLKIGKNFAMTGGTICAAHLVQIGNRVTVGSNTTIMDTDFHPIEASERRSHPADAVTAPVIIEDEVFIGLSCLILKGSRIGTGSVIGAGSVVVGEIPAKVVAAGNPARVISFIV